VIKVAQAGGENGVEPDAVDDRPTDMRPSLRRDLVRCFCAVGLAAAVLVSASACGSEQAGAGGGSQTATHGPVTPTATPTTSTTASTAPSTTPPGGRMTSGLTSPVVLQRGGGIAGVSDRVVVQPDGRCTVSTRNHPASTRQLTEKQLSQVVQAVHEADLAATPPSPTAVENDVFTYTLTAEGHTLRASQSNLPASVQPLVDVLRSLL
jgi:hypothetical protein